MAKINLVYGYDFPDAVSTDFFPKSTDVASSEIVSMDTEEYHSGDLRRILLGSEIRALDSFVRSSGRFGSVEIIVIEPLYPCSRRASTAPNVPLPLF